MTPTFRTFLAVALGVVTVAAAEKAQTYETGAQWLVVLLLGVATFVALCAACTALAAAVWFGIRYALYERRLDARIRECAPPPSLLGARHARPVPELDRLPELNGRTLARDARLTDYYGDDALTEARAASVEADQAPVRDGRTVPIVVVDAQPWPWSPAVAEPAGGGR